MAYSNELYTPELAQTICDYVASGKGLRQVARELNLSSTSLFRFVYENEQVTEQFKRARELQAETWTEDIMELAADESLTPESRRVQIDLRKWMISKLKPRVYGDKTILSNDPENPVSLLAIRLDEAIKKKDEPLMIDVTPAQPAPDDGSDLV